MGFQFPFRPVPGQKVATPGGIVFQWAAPPGGWVRVGAGQWPPIVAPTVPVTFPPNPAVGDSFVTDSGLTFVFGSEHGWRVLGSNIIASPWFLAGAGPPPNITGYEGNYYLDVSNGDLWGPYTGGAWPADPTPLVTFDDAPPTGLLYGRQMGSWQQALPIVGGQLTGPLLLSHDPVAATEAATKQYVDVHSAANLFLPLTGGTLTGPLTMDGAPGTPVYIKGTKNAKDRWRLLLGDSAPEPGYNLGSNFSVARYDDSGNRIDFPLTIDRSTGNLTTDSIKVAVAFPELTLDKTQAGQASSVLGSLNGVARWQMVLGDGAPESGSNAGSDFALIRSSDAGMPFPVLNIVRATGSATFANPLFAPTPTAGDNTTRVATTAFVTSAVAAATTGVSQWNGRTGAVTLTTADITGAGGAVLASPAFTGTPTAPTPTTGDNTTKLATTAFVNNTFAAGGVTSFNTRTGAVTFTSGDIAGAGGALLASPVFTGTPHAPTPSPGDNSANIATTAFVSASYAPLASPAFTGAPTAPTPPAGDNSTKIATTAFVDNVGSLPPIGAMLPYVGNAQPPGGTWLLCDGAPVSRTTYSALFNTPGMGTTYGVGDGSTTFNLPNMTGGRNPVAAGNFTDASGTTTFTAGQTGGEVKHINSAAELPVNAYSDSGHAHTVPVHGHGASGSQSAHSHNLVGGSLVASGAGPASGPSGVLTLVSGTTDSQAPAVFVTVNNAAAFNTTTNGASISNPGGGGGHNNMPPFVGVGNWIIRAL